MTLLFLNGRSFGIIRDVARVKNDFSTTFDGDTYSSALDCFFISLDKINVGIASDGWELLYENQLYRLLKLDSHEDGDRVTILFQVKAA